MEIFTRAQVANAAKPTPQTCASGLRRYMLATLDAHGLYAQFGFTPLSIPERIMEIKNNDVYVPPAL